MFNLTGLHCSFCGKSERDVEKLLAGKKAYICEACVDSCMNILAGDATWRERSIEALTRLSPVAR